MCVIKRKIKFESHKNCSEATQLQNKINYLEKYIIDMDSFKEDLKEYIKNNKLILKTQQRFRCEKHNVYTDEINKILLSSNDDKRIQSIDSIRTRTRKHAYRTRKDAISNKEEIKCKNIIEQYKND